MLKRTRVFSTDWKESSFSSFHLTLSKAFFVSLFFIFLNVFSTYITASTTSPHTHVVWWLPRRWLSQQTFAGRLSASWSACTSAAAWTSARPSRYGRYACNTPEREEERGETWESFLVDTVKGRATDAIVSNCCIYFYFMFRCPRKVWLNLHIVNYKG